MKIVLKCLHLNNVLLSLASIIFKILSVAFDMYPKHMYMYARKSMFQRNLTKNDYFPLIFHVDYLVYILAFFKCFTYVNVYIACTYICLWQKLYLQCSLTKFTYLLITLNFL